MRYLREGKDIPLIANPNAMLPQEYTSPDIIYTILTGLKSSKKLSLFVDILMMKRKML